MPWSSRRISEPFVANDCDLSPPKGAKAGRIWLLTGPNMAGKSTFLRQNALIVVLAQMGGFVPAKRAKIGVVDRLFSRVGAADDLARGRSTFMVEMVETAAILNQAGERSLVILDEIGRGTATFDGLSIAWAAIEHLHETQPLPRAVRDALPRADRARRPSSPRLHNATVRVKEWQGEVVFLHEVVPGAADRSYGIQVAKLAGLPRERDRARQGGAGDARGRGPRDAARLRGPAAVRGSPRPARARSAAERARCAAGRARRRSIRTKCRRARRSRRFTRSSKRSQTRP